MGYHQSGQETLSSVCGLQAVTGVKAAKSRNCRAQKWSLIILTVKTPQIIKVFIQGNTTLNLTYAAKSYLQVMLRLHLHIVPSVRWFSQSHYIMWCDYVKLQDDQYLLCRVRFDYFTDWENNMSGCHPLQYLCKCVYFYPNLTKDNKTAHAQCRDLQLLQQNKEILWIYKIPK